MSASDKKAPGKAPGTEVETTGHVWDDDLCEYNNPLPRWWLWGFYATVIFAIVYWLLYPAWPIASSFTKGFATVTFEVDGEPRTTHWNTRAVLVREMQSGEMALRQQEMLRVVADSSIDEVLSDATKLAFVNSYGRGMFGDNCAACHQTGGAGIIELYPNLADDNWHWGGDLASIEHSIRHGRMGYMPDFAETLDAGQLRAVSAYVLSIAGHEGDAELIARGQSIYLGPEGGCVACHRPDGAGLRALGAPDLRNNIWQNVDVLGAASYEERLTRVSEMVARGVNRQMPAFGDRLSEAEIRVLATYVHQFGGGQ